VASLQLVEVALSGSLHQPPQACERGDHGCERQALTEAAGEGVEYAIIHRPSLRALMEPASITFVRHGETESNATEVWQGHGDSPLTERGERQVKAFGERMQGRAFDRVVSSDLGRALATAEAATDNLTPDPRWRELDMGEWDGMARAEIFSKYGHLLAELRSGKDIRWGGAESYGEFVARIDAAVEELAASLLPGQRALVVTHGGVIHAVVAGLLGFRDRPRPWPVGRISNASLTTVEVAPRRLVAFNDAGHLNYEQREASVVTLVRHGETSANVRGWWHGTTDLDLTPRGLQQAEAVAAALPAVGDLVASSRLRAQRTAEAIGTRHGISTKTDTRLEEMNFGAWEGLTTPEIQERFPDEWQAVAAGSDLPRGGNGETFGQLGSRMMAATMAMANGAGGATAVTHGGSIKALVTRSLGLTHAERGVIALPGNASTTSVALAEDRVELMDFNAAAHLEG
jgi:probable phosphoglycerate mutase